MLLWRRVGSPVFVGALGGKSPVALPCPNLVRTSSIDYEASRTHAHTHTNTHIYVYVMPQFRV